MTTPYVANWVEVYDHLLPQRDRELKLCESKIVLRFLRKLEAHFPPSRFLDIGTCTGRYVRLLRKMMARGGLALGIDINPDGLRRATKLTARDVGDYARAEYLLCDFFDPSLDRLAPFDLVTCMMGTLAHICASLSQGAHCPRPLALALRRLKLLLHPDGYAVISTWSDAALAAGDLIGIYDREACGDLSRSSPTAEELAVGLAAAGLSAKRLGSCDGRLDVLSVRYRRQGE